MGYGIPMTTTDPTKEITLITQAANMPEVLEAEAILREAMAMDALDANRRQALEQAKGAHKAAFDKALAALKAGA